MAVNIQVFPRGSFDYFLNDRYRFQSYLGDSANNALNVLVLAGTSDDAENVTWTAQSQVHLAHKTLKSR